MQLVVTRIQRKLNKRLKSVQKKMVREPDSFDSNIEIASLMEKIKCYLDMNLTGFGMFELNGKLVSAFIYFVITFSVLSMQLTHP